MSVNTKSVTYNILHSPSLNITKSGLTSPGYLFFDQNGEYAHNYSLFIMSDDNELVWQSALGDYSDFRTQTFEGKPVLTFFNGISLPEPYGWGHGIIQVLDDSYTSIYNVSLTAAEENLVPISDIDPTQLVSYIDMHESRITAQDTILVTMYNVTQYDLSSVGGPEDGWVADCLFYELDVKTSEVLFRWSALAHVDEIPISDVQQFYPVADFGRNQSIPYGYFHINSVDKLEDGSYLISSRYYCSIFKISTDGSVEWTLQVSLFVVAMSFEIVSVKSLKLIPNRVKRVAILNLTRASPFLTNMMLGLEKTRGIFSRLASSITRTRKSYLGWIKRKAYL